jgi:phospholipase C
VTPVSTLRRCWLPAAAGTVALAAACLGLASPALAAPQAAQAHRPAAPAGQNPARRALGTREVALPRRADDSGPTLTESAKTVTNGSSITFTYSTPAATLASTNWIGIYEPGQQPGVVGSTTWQYTPDASGSVTFSTTSLYGVGPYVVYYFYDNGYQVLAGPVDFTVKGSNPAPAPAYARSFGATGRGQLSAPYGVATGPDGSVYVADQGTSRIEQFSRSGRLVRSFGAGLLSHPEAVTTGPGGHVWVADTGHDRVVEFSATGARLAAFGTAGDGQGQLKQPRGLAVSAAGEVYVADQRNNRIEEFSAAGRYLGQIAVATPAGVALDRSGDLWVSSPSYADGNAVYEFSPAGQQLQDYNSTQAEYGALSNPAGIAVGPAGRIYLAQPDYGFVTVLNPDGSFYTEFGLQSDAGRAAEDLAFPQGLAVGPKGTVWVADTGNHRIAEFSAAATASRPAAAAAAAPLPPAGPGLWPRLGWGLGAALLVAATLGAFLLLRRRGRPVLAAPGPVAAPMTDPSLAEAAERIVAPAAPRTSVTDAPVSRRTLLTGATALSGAAVGAAVLPLSLRQALAQSLASPQRGSLTDIKHIVILMQENRSFDHYYGTMPGVRGFSDPTAIKLPDGRPVFYQPDPSHAQGYLLPFHYDTTKTSAQATPGTDHSWPTQHQAWNLGQMNQWVAAKGPYTMGYFRQDDIPFHWALAEAFTICDNYHCSVLGPTNPNRLYMWTGMIDPQGKYGGPIIDNTPAFNNIILSWTTYPERLEAAGISWRIYQEEDNYDDNALAWFKQFGYAKTSSPLYQKGMLKLPAGTFEDDARHDRLPQVSWLVAPTAQTEHPDYFPAAGAEYIAQKLDAIASNPDVWAKTAFVLCYDENDGMFDHVPPPYAPAGTPGEFVDGENIGLGFRTPTTIVSPWTAGGMVCSDLFDHTSLIRFIEARFGVHEPNISGWRRQNCGDLTSAFRFRQPATRYPRNGELGLALTESRLLRAQRQVSNNPAPAPPAVNQPLPRQ